MDCYYLEMKMKYSSLFAVILPLAFADVAVAYQASYQRILPDTGDSYASAGDISANGQVVVGRTGLESFRWTSSGGYERLGYLPDPNPSSGARGVSADGGVVVGASNSTQNTALGFRWDTVNGMLELDAVGPPMGFDLSIASSVGNHGALIGGYSQDLPTVWTSPTSPIYAGVPGLSSFGEVTDVADNAPVAVGFAWVPSGNFQGFIWTPTNGYSALHPPGFESSGCHAISSDGLTVFGHAKPVSGNSIGFRWRAISGFEFLQTRNTSGNFLIVTAADGTGQSGVGVLRAGSSFTAAYWSEATGVVELRDLLLSRGVPFVPTTLKVSGISSDGNIIVGSEGPIAPGNAWFLARISPSDPQPIGVNYCGPAIANSINGRPVLEAYGSEIASANDLTLMAQDLPQDSFAIILASRAQALVPNFGGGLGTLCLGQTLGRLNRTDQIRQAGSFNTVALRVDLNGVAQPMGLEPVLPGETWNFQLWYRDRDVTGSVSNMSTGRSIQFQ